MAGSKSGAVRAVETIKKRYGENFYAEIGKKGGSKKVRKGFACNRVLAIEAGRKGGKIGRKRKKHESNLEQN